jgi:glycosyltransferase involved in cell wall biosynthesis
MTNLSPPYANSSSALPAESSIREVSEACSTHPKVSVLISAYNGETCIGAAVSSILGQTFQDYELIVVDDGSNDGTLNIIRSFNDSRIKAIEMQHSGLATALNTGARIARGEYIARLDQDDVSFSKRLHEQVNFLDEHPTYGIVGALSIVTQEGDHRQTVARMPLSDAAIRRRLPFENPFIHSCVMVRRSLLISVGLYNPACRWQDYDLWFRILECSKGENLPMVLCQRTLKPDRLSAVAKSVAYRDNLVVQYAALSRYGWSFQRFLGIFHNYLASTLFTLLKR